MDKLNTCKLCGWRGRTHIHHIIPVRDKGEDTDKNKIELCPNHHAEASEDETAFAEEHNLAGEEVSKEKLNALIEGSNLFVRASCKGDIDRLVEISKKYGFNKLDYVAYMMGITPKAVEKYLLGNPNLP